MFGVYSSLVEIQCLFAGYVCYRHVTIHFHVGVVDQKLSSGWGKRRHNFLLKTRLHQNAGHTGKLDFVSFFPLLTCSYIVSSVTFC